MKDEIFKRKEKGVIPGFLAHRDHPDVPDLKRQFKNGLMTKPVVSL